MSEGLELLAAQLPEPLPEVERVFTGDEDKPCVNCARPLGEHAGGAWSRPCPPVELAEERCLYEAAVTDDQIRAYRAEHREVQDYETARCCSAALGLPTGDGALGLLDAAICRSRIAARIAQTSAHRERLRGDEQSAQLHAVGDPLAVLVVEWRAATRAVQEIEATRTREHVADPYWPPYVAALERRDAAERALASAVPEAAT